MAKSKYNAKKVTYDDITFDSKREMNRYCELKLLERAGDISELKLQQKFVLIPTMREPVTVGKRGGIKQGKLLEKECSYIADFVYRDKNGELVVEDTKGMRTKDYIIKRKLMLFVHHISVKEV